MKQAGRKSVKEELPERRKGPKRAIECRLKVPTHVWEQDAGSSSLPTRTSSSQATYRLRRAFSFYYKAHRALILLLLASKPNPLHWAPVWYAALWAALVCEICISFAYTCQNKRTSAKQMSFCFEFRRPEGGFTLRYFNAQGGEAAPAQFPATGREFTRHPARGPEGPLCDTSLN